MRMSLVVDSPLVVHICPCLCPSAWCWSGEESTCVFLLKHLAWSLQVLALKVNTCKRKSDLSCLACMSCNPAHDSGGRPDCEVWPPCPSLQRPRPRLNLSSSSLSSQSESWAVINHLSVIWSQWWGFGISHHFQKSRALSALAEYSRVTDNQQVCGQQLYWSAECLLKRTKADNKYKDVSDRHAEKEILYSTPSFSASSDAPRASPPPFSDLLQNRLL